MKMCKRYCFGNKIDLDRIFRFGMIEKYLSLSIHFYVVLWVQYSFYIEDGECALSNGKIWQQNLCGSFSGKTKRLLLRTSGCNSFGSSRLDGSNIGFVLFASSKLFCLCNIKHVYFKLFVCNFQRC